MVANKSSNGVSPSTVPIIDFSKWIKAKNDKERMKVAKELVDGCRSIGFVYIINHNFPEELLLNDVFTHTEQLFNLTYDEKMQATHPPGTAVHRGYTEPNRVKINATTEERKFKINFNRNETFDVGSEECLAQPNQWLPEEMLPGFKDVATRFYWECNTVAQSILRAIAMGIGLEDPEHLTKAHSGIYNQLRLAHYMPISTDMLERNQVDRLHTHTDFSTITLVFQDDVGGLQIKNPYKDDDTFIGATPIKGAIVMNIGDPLMRWSNGERARLLAKVASAN